jgi:RND family efflux transporter MFP subunit
MKTIWLTVVAGVLAAVVVPAFAQTAPVATALVQSRALGSVYVLDGTIEAVKQSTLSAQTSGRVATLLVKAGDPVRAGQLIATIDDQETAAGVQRSQAQINQAQAELRNAQANLTRTRDLQAKGFISKAALDTADAQYQSALAQSQQASAADRQARISQGFTRVNAPYDGWVLETQVQAGDLAVPGKPLATVYAPLPLRAVVQVPASRAQAARTAGLTQVLVDGPQGQAQSIEPVARTAVPSADPVAQTTEWRLDLPAKDSAHLVPGQQVSVRFSQGKADATANASTTLLVPQAAIVRRGELTAVYVANQGAFTLRAVRVGANLGADGVEVLSGLRAGESVALDPVRAGYANATPAATAK